MKNQSATNEFPSAPGITKRDVAIFGIRFCSWLLVLFGGAFLIIPEFHKLFEEFGIAIPTLTQYAFTLSDRAHHFAYLFIPIAFLAVATIELTLLFIPRGNVRILLTRLDLVLLLCAILFIGAALVLPTIAIARGLSG